jgi:hypothetical protein
MTSYYVKHRVNCDCENCRPSAPMNVLTVRESMRRSLDRKLALSVPNRLYGVEINERGEAI